MKCVKKINCSFNIEMFSELIEKYTSRKIYEINLKYTYIIHIK